MRSLNRILLVTSCASLMLIASPGWAQETTQERASEAAESPDVAAREKNIQEYISLIRADVRQQKAEIMGALMLLSAQDATKFWPIYSEYDARLTKLNDQRVANMKEYVRTYTELTDEKADELIQRALSYRKQRSELLANTYERIKQALGAITAARFIQIEDQLLSIIDLQIASQLPIAGEGS